MAMTLPVEWFPSEWNDDGFSAYLDGIVGDVYPDDSPYTPHDLPWAWSVKPTSTRCEWPELIDYGNAQSAEVARRKATQAMVKANEQYPHINYG